MAPETKKLWHATKTKKEMPRLQVFKLLCVKRQCHQNEKITVRITDQNTEKCSIKKLLNMMMGG